MRAVVGSFRFRKQFKLAPGLTLRINNQSASATLGVRGAKVTYNTKGQVTTSAGLPGTGVSYRHTATMGAGAGRDRKPSRSEPVGDVFREPVWTTEVEGTTLAIMFAAAAVSYDLWVCDGPWAAKAVPGMRNAVLGGECVVRQGLWRYAGSYGADYFKARAAAEVWAEYLRNGGTVAAWRGQQRK